MRHTVLPAIFVALCSCGGGNGAGGSGGQDAASGGSGGSAGAGLGGGSGGGSAASSLQLYANQNLQAFVDSAGTYTNVYPESIAVYGGAPAQAGYRWSCVLGPGLPSTVTVDPVTGLFGGTLPSNFVIGPPGTADGATYIYDLTVTVSDGTSSVSSAPGQMRVFISPCNSTPPYGSARSCAGQPSNGGSITPPSPQGPPIQLAYDANTQQVPFDLTYPGVVGVHVGKPFGATLPFQGGTAPYTFIVVSGVLPPGLSLLASSATVAGTISAAAFGSSYPFTVTVTDGAGNQNSAYYVLGSTASPLLK
jgi:hypothetical protein